MALGSGVRHIIGCLAILAIAISLLLFVFPPLVAAYVPSTTRFVGLRGEAIDFFLIALIPILVWLVPPIVRGLARLTHRGHQAFLGKVGFYIRFPTPRRVRFWYTLVQALGPLAIDLVVISEIVYFLSDADARTFGPRLFALPLLLLAGVVTSLLPGPWLVSAMDLRLVNPAKGEVVREASLFEGLFGPIAALALLVSFVTTAHAEGDSYTQGIVILGLWATRIFPAVLVAVSVYRIVIEPNVLPSLEAWAAKEGIETKSSLPDVLAALRPLPPPPSRNEVPTPSGSSGGGRSARLSAAPRAAEPVRHEDREQGD